MPIIEEAAASVPAGGNRLVQIYVGPFARVTSISFGPSACGVERVGYTFSESEDRLAMKCTDNPALLRLDSDSHTFPFDPVLIARGGYVLVRVVNDTDTEQPGPTISVQVQ